MVSEEFPKTKIFFTSIAAGQLLWTLLSPIIEQLTKLCGVAWLLWQRMVTASLPGGAGGEPAAWSRVGEALAAASVSWTRGLGGVRGAELTGGGGHRGRRPSQWSWGRSMRGMWTGWGAPSCSSSLSQGFPKLSRSHLFPSLLTLSPHPLSPQWWSLLFLLVLQTTCVDEEQTSA